MVSKTGADIGISCSKLCAEDESRGQLHKYCCGTKIFDKSGKRKVG
jgi:hypothetical protein